MEGYQLVIVIAGVMTLFLVARWALLKWDKAEERAAAMEEKMTIYARSVDRYLELKGYDTTTDDPVTFQAAVEWVFEHWSSDHWEFSPKRK